MSQPRIEFGGFALPMSNFFRVPNEMINIIARIKSLAELKVILYLIRHTWGFQEYGVYKAISTDEFEHGRRYHDGTRMDDGTGLSNRSVIDGLRLAEEHGYVVCKVDDSDRGRTVKYYMLNMQACEDSSQPYEGSSQPPSEESSQAPMKDLHSRREESSHRSEKETLERNSQKNTKKERTRSTTQSSSSLLDWIREEKVTCPKDQEKVREYLAALAPITSREQLHRLKEFAAANIRGTNKKIFLGNLAGSLDDFLEAEKAMQAFLPDAEPTPVESASESEIGALADEIASCYPELVLRVGTDEYGAYIEAVYGEGKYDFWLIRHVDEWRAPGGYAQKSLTRARSYGKQRYLVA